jgi:plastocyanin
MTTISRSRRGWQVIGLAVAALIFGLALAGIRGDIAAAGGSAQASRAATVKIDNFAFHPPTLTVSAGAKVAFSNSDGATHTATRSGSFDTGDIAPGKSVTVRFTHKGTFSYHCEIHPSMHGKIVVK